MNTKLECSCRTKECRMAGCTDGGMAGWMAGCPPGHNALSVPRSIFCVISIAGALCQAFPLTHQGWALIDCLCLCSTHTHTPLSLHCPGFFSQGGSQSHTHGPQRTQRSLCEGQADSRRQGSVEEEDSHHQGLPESGLE